MKLIDKSAVVAEIEGLKRNTFTNFDEGVNAAAQILLDFLDTLEVKEVDIASMADDYYDALMEEASVWMDEGTMCHCRLAYYNGCKDVLNKIQKENDPRI
jgi:hypothetical protein